MILIYVYCLLIQLIDYSNGLISQQVCEVILKAKFEEWYASQLTEQLEENSMDELEPIATAIGLPILKELGVVCLVEMDIHISQNPEFIENGFIKADISVALDGTE